MNIDIKCERSGGIGPLAGGMAIALSVALLGGVALPCYALDGSPGYEMLEPYSTPQPGPGLPSPTQVPGKEFSHDGDFAVGGTSAVPWLGQVVAWDGKGGVADGVVLFPVHQSLTFQLDAIANHADTLFMPLLEERSHLMFSVDDRGRTATGDRTPQVVPGSGPLTTTSGLTLGGAAEISYELGTISPHPVRMGTWATSEQILIGTTITDVDGLEMWGPEPQIVPPGMNAADSGDSNKFSIANDSSLDGPGGPYAVWNKGNRPNMPGYLLHSDLVAAVSPLMGWVGATGPAPEQIDLDALMVLNAIGTNPDAFDSGDRILLSLAQIPNPQGGFYATGSEIILLTHNGQGIDASFLVHNGHAWDKAWAEQNLVVNLGGLLVQLDINALEAASVPEPATLLVGTLLALTAGALLRRRQAG